MKHLICRKHLAYGEDVGKIIIRKTDLSPWILNLVKKQVPQFRKAKIQMVSDRMVYGSLNDLVIWFCKALLTKICSIIIEYYESTADIQNIEKNGQIFLNFKRSSEEQKCSKCAESLIWLRRFIVKKKRDLIKKLVSFLEIFFFIWNFIFLNFYSMSFFLIYFLFFFFVFF